MAGRLSKWGMWRFVEWDRILGRRICRAEEEASEGRENQPQDPSMLAGREMGTARLRDCVHAQQSGQGKSRKTALRLKSPECIDDGEGARVSCAKTAILVFFLGREAGTSRAH